MKYFGIFILLVVNQANALQTIYKAPPKPDVVAKIAGQEVTEKELIGSSVKIIELRKREYDLKIEKLTNLAILKISGPEAEKSGMTIEEFIEKKIFKGKLEVTEADYKKFVIEKLIREDQVSPQNKEKIFDVIRETKKEKLLKDYGDKITKNNAIEVYFNKPRMLVPPNIGQAPTLGAEDAPVTIIEFTDFECPYCSKAAQTLKELKNKYGKKLRFAYRNLPLPSHSNAVPAAEAAMCVNEQGSPKFWKFHDLVFNGKGKLDKESLSGYAKASDTDMPKFEECVTAKKYSDFVQKDVEYAKKIGIMNTPTFFVNDHIVSGAVSFETMAKLIDDELSAR